MAKAKKTTIKTTGGRKKTTSARRSSSSRKQVKVMPHWQYILIATVASAIVLFIAYHLVFKRVIFRFTTCEGIKVYDTCIPKGYNVYGLDISHHQGKINWEKFKEENPKDTPIQFVYMKASEGSDHKDTQFDANWEKAKEHGFTRGAYHYFSPYSTGLEQATMFIQTVKLEKGDLAPVIDVEEKPDNKTLFLQELKIFIAKIEEHYGIKPIIYSGKKYKARYLNDKYFERFPTWIAHYYVDTLEVNQTWTIWQCSDRGRLPGINRNVDINIFNGTPEALENFKKR